MWLMNTMNYMKKTFKIKFAILITFIIILIISCLIVIMIKRKQTYLAYLTNLETYYLNEENKTFDVDIYSSVQEDYYLNLDTINIINLVDEKTNDSFLLKTNQVIEEKETIEYDNQEFYKYQFSFELPISKVEDEFQIEVAKLSFEYKSGENIVIPIGSMIVYQNIKNKNLEITHLKGIVNQVENTSVLTGIGLTLSSKKNLTINKIELLDKRITIQGKEIIELEDSNYSNAILMQDLLGKEYTINNFEKSFNEIFLHSNQTKHFILPLAYQEIKYINTIALRIHYQIENINYSTIVYPFKFFNSTDKECIITKYEQVNN